MGVKSPQTRMLMKNPQRQEEGPRAPPKRAPRTRPRDQQMPLFGVST